MSAVSTSRLKLLRALIDGDVEVDPVNDAEWKAILDDLVRLRELTATRQVNLLWLNTEVDPRKPATGFDAGRTSWKFHGVLADPRESFRSIESVASLCGIVPAHGWTLDLFMDIDDAVAGKCTRCERAARRLGLEAAPTEVRHA